MELGLKGKTALVTGASEGIGKAIARKLAEEGVRVAICARTAAKLQETAEAMAHATGMEIVPIPADLRSLAGCEGFVEQAARRLGGIDILVNNAGASAFGAFMDLPDDAFVDAINGKLLGTFAAPGPPSRTCNAGAAGPSSISPAPPSKPRRYIHQAAPATLRFGCLARSSR